MHLLIQRDTPRHQTEPYLLQALRQPSGWRTETGGCGCSFLCSAVSWRNHNKSLNCSMVIKTELKHPYTWMDLFCIIFSSLSKVLVWDKHFDCWTERNFPIFLSLQLTTSDLLINICSGAAVFIAVWLGYESWMLWITPSPWICFGIYR